MKRLLIGDRREKLLSTLEVILKHWGYRVLVSSQPEQIGAFIEESSLNLLLIGAPLLTDKNPQLRAAVTRKVAEGSCPLAVLADPEQEAAEIDIPHQTLGVPLNVFALFELIQTHLQKHPRKNLRLDMKLPGMLCQGESCHLAEVLSLSTRGLFIKTGTRLGPGDRLRVAFPLLGMKKELEIEGRELYRVQPGPENNYLQGVGIEFESLNEETRKDLEAFVEGRFLSEVSAGPRGLQGLAEDQIQGQISKVPLRLTWK